MRKQSTPAKVLCYVFLILVILFYPKGIMGLIEAVRNRLLAKSPKGTEGGAKDAG